jgi:hypothetical protein
LLRKRKISLRIAQQNGQNLLNPANSADVPVSKRYQSAKFEQWNATVSNGIPDEIPPSLGGRRFGRNGQRAVHQIGGESLQF